MRITTLVLGLVLCTLGALTGQSNSLQPKALVAAQRGYYFEPVAPFQLSAEKVNSPEAPAAHDLLEVDEAVLAQLNRQTPPRLLLKLPSSQKKELTLQLVRVDLFAPDFALYESSNEAAPTEVEGGAHYRGVIAGSPNSIAAVSIFPDEIMGLVSGAGPGNLVLGKLDGEDNTMKHLLYSDREVLSNLNFECATPDDGPDYSPEQLAGGSEKVNNNDCVRIYLEVDHDIYLNKGGTSAATNYVTGLFNQVATLYANENVNTVISEILVWNTPSPYSSNSSSGMLNQFQNVRTSFNGDLGQLLSYQASGGIAVLSGLCHPYTSARLSFSSIYSSYNVVPTYSWSVMVVAHEFGHLLGSKHTHACAWNGNNTAIDGCAGFTEGSCPWPGYPSTAGTIMSYCHLTSAGISFTQGFGPQPGNVIRSVVNNANCLQACSGGGGGGGNDDDDPVTSGDCDENTLYISIVVDDYGPETTWSLLDVDSNVVASGGPYDKAIAGTEFKDTLCLPDGCYSFAILDEYGDGICCQYGAGNYAITDGEGDLLASGGQFGAVEWSQLCLNADPTDFNCLEINFNDYQVISFGGPQDNGYAQLLSSGEALKIGNNAWKAIPLNYNVTPNTVLELEFGSTAQGEIHGIGFDENTQVSYQRTFKLFGTQPWGILNYDNYNNLQNWTSYTIPVGQFYTGQMSYLFFVADHDYGNPTGNSYFRKIRIHEGDGCPDNLVSDTGEPLVARAANVRVFPNPAQETVQVQFRLSAAGASVIELYDLRGRRLRQVAADAAPGDNNVTVNLRGLAAGAYLLRLRSPEGEYTEKISVTK